MQGQSHDEIRAGDRVHLLGSPGDRVARGARTAPGPGLRRRPSLRARVEELLAAYPKAERFLEAPAGDPDSTAEGPSRGEGPGTVIGPYKLLEQSAKGAWAWSTWPSRRSPVRRKVALKIIKPGMDTRQVVARFEAERQALAIMDHPNIAKVLDGGADAPRAGRTSSWSWSRACRSPSTATRTT